VSGVPPILPPVLAFLLLAGTPPCLAGEGPSGPSPSSRLTVLPPERGGTLDPAVEAISRKLDRDLDYLLSSPFRVTPKGAAGAGLTLAVTLLLLDGDRDRLEDLARPGGSASEKAYGRLRNLGRNVPETALALYLGGYLLDSPGLKADALLGGEAVALTALLTAVSSPVIGHASPSQSAAPDDFRGFDRYHSMPDMDSALAFSLAGAVGYGKGFWANLGLFTLATGAGLSRVHARDAWPSDVFIGGVLGTVIGRSVASLANGGGETAFAPVFLPGREGPVPGLGVALRF